MARTLLRTGFHANIVIELLDKTRVKSRGDVPREGQVCSLYNSCQERISIFLSDADLFDNLSRDLSPLRLRRSFTRKLTRYCWFVSL